MRALIVILALLLLTVSASAGIQCWGGCSTSGGGGGTPCSNAQFDQSVACNAVLVFAVGGM